MFPYLAVDETRDTRHETRATRYKRDIRQETCLVFRVSSVISRLSTEAGRTHFLPPQCFVYRIPGSCRGRFLRKFLGERSGKRAPGSHASEIIVRPQHREQRPNSFQLAAWLCVCRLGWLSLLRRPKSARWPRWSASSGPNGPSGQHLELLWRVPRVVRKGTFCSFVRRLFSQEVRPAARARKLGPL